MKQIQAVIRSHFLERVLESLHEFEHFSGVTFFPCEGEGRGHGEGRHFEPIAELFRPAMHRIEVLCRDVYAPQIVRAIERSAHTGKSGDGIIAVTDLIEVVRISSGERGDAAL